MALGLLAALATAAPGHAAAAKKPAVRKASNPNAASASAARPDRALYQEALAARATLRNSPRRLARVADWEAVILRYRRVVARYPQSAYCDDALLGIGDLYRQMAQRFAPIYAEDAVAAYRAIVSEYPSSRHGDQALFRVFEIAQRSGDRRRIAEAGRKYLEAFPGSARAAEVKAQLRKRTPAQAASLPGTPPPGLARVFNVRFWSGKSSTRVVLDVERQVALRYDRISQPERLWVDLQRTRLHPNLTDRSFPVGDGLLRQIRIAQNRDDVVRIVLDFKEVRDHSVFYLDNPTRVVIDVRGDLSPQMASADAPAAAAAPDTPGVRPPARPAPGVAAPDVHATTPTPAPAPPLPAQANRAGSYSLARQLGLSARTIVIDAGHGGHDPGTIGPRGLQEKDVVLDVALRLARLVRARLGAEVILTRSTDVFVPLEERTAIANSKGADLFLSIHANASRSPRPRGVETYFLSFAADPHAEAVAARENAISAATMKDLQNLVKAIALNSKLDESRDFASSVQEAMVANIKPHYPSLQDRGVRTAPFYVLIGANMPSILAEIAFVSHPEEERMLGRSEHRERVAWSLCEGVRAYLETLNRTQMRQLTGPAGGSTVGGRETRK
ncbi:MAG TPA: N-acetylmuramoyl-L-alanine amidase [Vicinamibacteria bacterium]|nr:N-acetylmuramoyl-L-alanine amidase [Vicinamibacteria bacterium]